MNTIKDGCSAFHDDSTGILVRQALQTCFHAFTVVVVEGDDCLCDDLRFGILVWVFVLVNNREILMKFINTFQEQIDLRNNALATHEEGKLSPKSDQAISDGIIFQEIQKEHSKIKAGKRGFYWERAFCVAFIGEK